MWFRRSSVGRHGCFSPKSNKKGIRNSFRGLLRRLSGSKDHQVCFSVAMESISSCLVLGSSILKLRILDLKTERCIWLIQLKKLIQLWSYWCQVSFVVMILLVFQVWFSFSFFGSVSKWKANFPAFNFYYYEYCYEVISIIAGWHFSRPFLIQWFAFEYNFPCLVNGTGNL